MKDSFAGCSFGGLPQEPIMPMKAFDKVFTGNNVPVRYVHYGCEIAGYYPTPLTSQSFTSRRFQLAIDIASKNNKANRPWSNWGYTIRHAFGGPHRRQTNVTNWCNFGYNDYGYPYGGPKLTEYTRYNQYGHPWPYHSVSTPSCESEAVAIATARLASRLKDLRTQWNFAVTLGEARETSHFIAAQVRRLTEAYRQFRKGNVMKAWRGLTGRGNVPVHLESNLRFLKRRAKQPDWSDDAARAWMEFNYAWVPTLGDIDSAARYLAEKRVRGYFPVQEVSVSATARQTDKVNYNPSGPNNWWYRDTRTSKTHVRLTYHLTPSWARQPSTLDELGFTDPFTLAWELLPLSFVVDWIVNVGQVLQSLFEFRQWSVIKGIRSLRTQFWMVREITRNWLTPTGGLAPLGKEFLDPWYFKWQKCRRELVSTLPTAVPLRVRVSNPFDLNLGQWATSVVLLKYAFR
jgi:hypothetical protein